MGAKSAFIVRRGDFPPVFYWDLQKGKYGA
jgi:hypothetical protein